MTQLTQLSTDLPTITAEINAYKRVAGEAIFEIGKRLKHVKKNDLAHGQWERWCREEIEMTPQHANKFIRVSERFGNRTSTFGLGVDMLALLTSESDEFVSQPHTIPSTGAVKTVDEMTVRELREVKAQLKAEREAREKAEADYELVRDTLSAMHDRPPQVEYVHVTDEETEERLRQYEQRYGDIGDTSADSYATNSQDLTATVMQFSRGVREFTKKFSYLAQYSGNIAALDVITGREYKEAVMALYNFISVLPVSEFQGKVVIDIN